MEFSTRSDHDQRKANNSRMVEESPYLELSMQITLTVTHSSTHSVSAISPNDQTGLVEF